MLPHKILDADCYIQARNKYNPKVVNQSIKFLLIGESPPANGGYFYFEKAVGRGNLFRETMKALEIPLDKMSKGYDKGAALKEFQARGFFLIDVCYEPVNKLTLAEKNRIIKREIPRLIYDIKALEPQPEKIIIIKKSNFSPVKSALESCNLGDKILNKKPIPFPSNGWQLAYRKMLREITNY